MALFILWAELNELIEDACMICMVGYDWQPYKVTDMALNLAPRADWRAIICTLAHREVSYPEL